MITEFQENEHLSGLESLIIQHNNSAADSRFRVLVNHPPPLMADKVADTLKLCEVDFQMTQSNFTTNNIS